MTQNLWTQIATAAANLPTNHPGKESIVRTLANAGRKATAEVPGMFSRAWYDAAVKSIVADDAAAARFFFARVSDAYWKAYAEIACDLEEGKMR